MILLDTHVWIWYVQGDPRLDASTLSLLQQNEKTGLGLSIISCWEVAKLHQKGRIAFSCPLDQWIEIAQAYPGIQVIPLNAKIILDSVQLPGSFHPDPADQLIVATARVLQIPLVTLDAKIRAYPHVTFT